MKNSMAKVQTKVFLLIMLMASVILLNGCGIGADNEKKLFDAMKDNGFLDLTCNYEDYDEVREVSQSPVPDTITYYDYSQDGKLYTIDYCSRILGENDSVYQVRVTIESEGKSDTKLYMFEKETFAFREKK